MLILNTCSFPRKVLPNTKCVLVCSLEKGIREDVLKTAVQKTLIFAEKYP